MWIRRARDVLGPVPDVSRSSTHSEDIGSCSKGAMVAVVVIGVWSMLQFALGAHPAVEAVAGRRHGPHLRSSSPRERRCGVRALALTQFPKLFHIVSGRMATTTGRTIGRGSSQAWSVGRPADRDRRDRAGGGRDLRFAGRANQQPTALQALQQGTSRS